MSWRSELIMLQSVGVVALGGVIGRSHGERRPALPCAS